MWPQYLIKKGALSLIYFPLIRLNLNDVIPVTQSAFLSVFMLFSCETLQSTDAFYPLPFCTILLVQTQFKG